MVECFYNVSKVERLHQACIRVCALRAGSQLMSGMQILAALCFRLCSEDKCRYNIIIETASDPRIKALRIKTGIVKRLAKEKVMYEKEIEDQGKDEHDIRKQEEVLQESIMMVPDCQRRLVKAYDELKLENRISFE
ncbi:hypothetical protein ANN_07042 [Periplaneta americana]|uniref:Tubulin-specific chaperone A n=1 Tax=Periplaneta americana TaxID=6978 RepID=A0ABQ8TF57_PERAM|nr:hypothetical protein ANN_07042 [Periplaneta americana]